VEQALQQNEVFNIFENDFACLADDDAAVGNNAVGRCMLTQVDPRLTALGDRD
jgi:hypothetical protein